MFNTCKVNLCISLYDAGNVFLSTIMCNSKVSETSLRNKASEKRPRRLFFATQPPCMKYLGQISRVMFLISYISGYVVRALRVLGNKYLDNFETI